MMHQFSMPKKWMFLFAATFLTVASGLSFKDTPAYAGTSYVVDAANHTITVSPNAPDASTDISNALDYLRKRSDTSTTWTLKFASGKYVIRREIRAAYLQNVKLVSDRSNPAKLVKDPGSKVEYIFYFTLAKNISLNGFVFYGTTNFASNNNPVWGEQGVYFGSCNGVTVDWSRFYNFGDAALRVTTDNDDPVKGIDSFNTKVTNSIFNNIYQVSTTSNDEVHGATTNYLFQYNSVYNLKGSVKFASRTPGANNVRVINNIFNGSANYGVEVNNYTHFTIANNQMSNIAGPAISIYTMDRAASDFHWGDNFTINGNTISNSGRAIRFSPNPYPDGTKVVPKNLVVSANTISGIKETDPYIPAIGVFKGTVAGVTITNNKLSKLSNRKAVGYTSGCTDVTATGNTLDDTTSSAMKL